METVLRRNWGFCAREDSGALANCKAYIASHPGAINGALKPRLQYRKEDITFMTRTDTFIFEQSKIKKAPPEASKVNNQAKWITCLLFLTATAKEAKSYLAVVHSSAPPVASTGPADIAVLSPLLATAQVPWYPGTTYPVHDRNDLRDSGLRCGV